MNKALMACAVVLGCMWTATPAFATTVVEPAPPLLECDADSDCAAGELCAFEEVMCPPCAYEDADGDGENDYECPPCGSTSGVCVPQADTCTADVDCADDEYCDFGDVAVGVGCACPFVDEDSDGENDVACDCPEPATLPAPTHGVCVEEWDPGTCTADSDCGFDEECVIDTQCYEACPAIAGEDGEPVGCTGGCEQVSYCAPVHYCGVDEPVLMPTDDRDDIDFGELFGCNAAKSGAPTDASLVALGLFGLVALARRRRD